MDQNDIALELIVRCGSPHGVIDFAKKNGVDESEFDNSITEAGVYSAIKNMWEDAEGGIDSDSICDFFNRERFSNYFSSTENVEIIERILDVLIAGTNAMMEACCQITPIDILAIESFSGAVRRNINQPNFEEKVTKLVNAGYSLTFCPHDIDAGLVNHYFPLINEWKEFINPLEITKNAITDFENYFKNLHEPNNRYKKDFFYTTLEKLIILTDRDTVSQLMHETYNELPGYQKIIEDGKIDTYVSNNELIPEFDVSSALSKEMERFESSRFPSYWDVQKLEKVMSSDNKEETKYVSSKVKEWFKIGKIRHIIGILDNGENLLYDLDSIQDVINNEIIDATEQKDYNRLKWYLKFPENVIDQTHPEIESFFTAYTILLENDNKPMNNE